MNSRASVLLAEFLAKHLEVCAEAMLAAAPPEYAEPGRPILREWIQSQIDYYRGMPDRANEWVVLYMDTVRRTGADVRESLTLVRILRDVVLRMCRGNVPGLSDADLYELLIDTADRHTRLITEYGSQIEREAVASERRRQRIIAECMDRSFSVLDPEGIILLANSRLARELGQPLDGLVGREFAQFCEEETAAEIRRALRHKRSNQIRTFAGHFAAPRLRQTPFRFQVQAMFDAQGRRDSVAISIQREDAIASSGRNYLNQALSRIIDSIPIAVQIFSKDHRIVLVNDTATHHWGDLAQQPLCCALTTDAGGQCVCRRVVERCESHQGEVRWHDGISHRWFSLFLAPIQSQDDSEMLVACALREITAQRNLENQVLHQQRTSLAAQLAMTVSHELRNPLGVLIGFAEMLAKGLPPEQVPGVVDRMLRNSIRCKEIVEDLLEFGRGFPGERVPADLCKNVREIVQPMFTSSQQSHIEWRVPEVACFVECVPAQLAQVFASLLDNALRAAKSRVAFTIEPRAEDVLVHVCDDGVGVPDDLRDRIFQPFFTTRKHEGAVGLGLSLSQAVIQEYGGSLYLAPPAEAGQDGGAWFIAQLPLVHEQAAVAVKEVRLAEPPVAQRHILVVDDEIDLLDMLAMALEMRGYAVITASSAAEAIEQLRQAEYDAIVLDVKLPGDLGGPQLFEYIQGAYPKLAHHALFITADTMNYETRKFLERVQRPSMEKPFMVYEFADRVTRLIEEPLPGETLRSS